MKGFTINKWYLVYCLVVLCIYSNIINAQQHSCGFDLANSALLNKHPNLEILDQETESLIYKNTIAYLNSLAAQKSITDNTVYTVPVAFHVVHKTTDALGFGSNLTDAQIQNAINYLNDTYSNSGISYQTNGIDTNIEFCLMNISRHASNELSDICYNTEDSEMKSVNGLDPNKYLNIWSVNSVVFHKKDSNGNVIQPCGLSTFGYTFRAYNHGNPNDGVVIEATSLLKSTFPHEVGHYLDLYHTYERTNPSNPCQNNNCFLDGDRVCDTPPDTTIKRVNCFANEKFNSCTTDADDPSSNNPFSFDVVDMTDNFMDSNYTYCRFRFTEGQRIRMRTALLNVRNSLLHNNPVADFTISTSGTTVTFSNKSQNSNNYFWNFGDGTSSTQTNPTHTFNTIGQKTICLTASNNSLCNTSNQFCLNINITESSIPNTQNCITHYENSFENTNDWNNLYDDDIDWILKTESTPSYNTGPTNASKGNSYIYIESSSPNYGGKNSKLSIYSGNIPNQIYDLNLDFDYHMYGTAMGTLRLLVYENGNYTYPSTLWIQSGNQGDIWRNKRINLNAFIGKNIEIVFEGITGTSYTSDMAIDNIVLTSCSNSEEEPTINECQEIFSNGFENGIQSNNLLLDDIDWLKKAGSTASLYTGPNAAFEGTYYMYIEASGNNYPHKNASLSVYDNFLNNDYHDVNFSFYYNMYGFGMGTLRLVAIVNKNDNNPITVWSKSGDSGSNWQQQTVSLNNFIGSDIELRFEGETGQSYTSDIAIDNLTITACSGTSISSACTNQITIPYIQSFENTIDSWIQETSDDMDWLIRSGKTPSSYTGPDQAYHGNYYLYVEASGNAYKEASITSPCFDLSETSVPIFFIKRNMEGNSMGTLTIDFYGNGSWYNDVMVISNTTNAVGEWGTIGGAIYDLEPQMQNCNDCKIRIKAQVGPSYQSDIAIDQFEIFDAVSGSRLDQTLDDGEIFESLDFTVFPNPARDYLNISLDSFGSVEDLFVTNILGQRTSVLQSGAGLGGTQIDLSDFPSGTYILTVVYNFGKTKSKRFVVE